MLATAMRGSMAHFKLQPGQVSIAVMHQTVEEVWYVLKGSGRMWRKFGDYQEVTTLCPGISITIAVHTYFQYRCDGIEPLEAIGVTMPPWPGMDEAVPVTGCWSLPGPGIGHADPRFRRL
jgi:mannose-6-phosphate isomerase-like protein (cupin superfamily)